MKIVLCLGHYLEDIIISIFKNCPIGLTDEDLNDILSDYFIFDDNNNYMYNYLLLLEELQIIQFYFSTSHNLIPNDKFQYGFFTKNEGKIYESEDIEFKRRSSYHFINLEDDDLDDLSIVDDDEPLEEDE